MVFLRVFCVVLCLYYGDCLHPSHNDPGILYQNKRNEEYYDQRNHAIPSNLAYNFNNEPSRIKQHGIGIQSQVYKDESERVSKTNEGYLRQNEGIDLLKKMPPRYVNSQSFPQNNEYFEQINKNLRRPQGAIPKLLNAKPFKNIESSFIRQEVKPNLRSETTNKFPKLHAIIKDNEPFKSEEPIKLELQGLSPDNIESLIRTQKLLPHNHQLPSKSNQLRNFNDDYSKNLRPFNYESNPSATATFQNPSAESVYKLKQALPYKINYQQFSNVPQNKNLNNQRSEESLNLRNILSNSRYIQDRHKNGYPRKRFTIIYPDGKIGYANKIEEIAQIHPNYSLIKSNEIRKYLQGSNTYSTLRKKPKKENPPMEPSKVNQLHTDRLNGKNIRKAYVDSDSKDGKKFEALNNPSTSSSDNIIYNTIKETFPGSTARPKLDVNNANKTSTTTIETSTILEITTETPANNITRENSLPKVRESPVYTNNLLILNPETSTNTTKAENHLSPTSATTTNSINISSDLVIDSTNATNITNSIKPLQANSGAFDNSTKTQPKLPYNLETSTNITNTDRNFVLKPEISNNITAIKYDVTEPSKNTTTNAEYTSEISNNATIIENNLSPNPSKTYDTKKYPEATTTEDSLPIKLQNNTDDDIKLFHVKGQKAIVFDISSINENTYNKTNLTEISVPDEKITNVRDAFNLERYKESIDVNNSSVVANNKNAQNSTLEWFEAGDEFWNKMLTEDNENNAFYFLFVPPVLNTKIETKTTIYPNGTQFEERIETTVDKDGVPKISKQTTVTVKNATDGILVN